MQRWLTRETLLDVSINVVPFLIIGYFLALFALIEPWGGDLFPTVLNHLLLAFHAIVLAVVSYVGARTIAIDEANPEEPAQGVPEEGAWEDEGHHHPAPMDWPSGFGEASWWPIVSAIGVAGLYVGASLVLVAVGEPALIPLALGAITLAGGVAIGVAGLGGWLWQAFVADYWSRTGGKSRSLWLGTVLFLGTEIATFGAGFAYYGFIRIRPWPPGHLPDLLSSLVAANTIILVASSVTLHVAHEALQDGDHQRFRRWLGVTVLAGVVFLAGQAFEYFEFVVHEGFTLTSGIYASAFFGLTGLHGFHVTLGVVMLAIVLARALRGQYDADRDTSVTTVSMYWHFVDVVWLVLVASLYVGAAI